MFSKQTKRNLLRIIPFGVIWLVFSFVYSMLERGLLAELTFYPSTGNPYDFSGTVFITAGTALCCGLFIGSIEVLYLSKLFIRKSFAQKMIFKTLIYLTFITLFVFLTSLFFNAFILEQNVFSAQPFQNALDFFLTLAFWSVTLYVGSIIAVSLFIFEVNENLGHGVVTNFFSGKYHKPKEEERIFMFLDMKASTTIAEQIGHSRYFNMLKQYFSDLSGPIVEFSGEVYQYVGDEVVITWKLKNGLQNNNCIRCFFALKETLHKREADYKTEFGLVPSFKAGLHVGKVTTGEIGVIKKEIIFTGDVLNTTARIQGLCNTYNTDMLASAQLVKKLLPEFNFRSIGSCELRGRGEKIELFAISN